MNLTLIRSMTRSAVFELENELCYRPAHPFTNLNIFQHIFIIAQHFHFANFISYYCLF